MNDYEVIWGDTREAEVVWGKSTSWHLQEFVKLFKVTTTCQNMMYFKSVKFVSKSKIVISWSLRYFITLRSSK